MTAAYQISKDSEESKQFQTMHSRTWAGNKTAELVETWAHEIRNMQKNYSNIREMQQRTSREGG